jgi:hypothetical protein
MPGKLVQLPLRVGLDESVDPKLAPAGAVLTHVENAVWNKVGRLEKRAGASPVPNDVFGGGSLPEVDSLLSRDDELAALAGGSVYAYAPGISKWREVDRAPAVSATWRTHIERGGRVVEATVDANEVYTVTAWVEHVGGGALTVYVRVTDTGSEAVLLPETPIADPFTHPDAGDLHVFILTPTAAVVVFQSTTTQLIAGSRIDLDTMTIGNLPAITIRTDADSLERTLSATKNGATFTIAYKTAGGTVQVCTFDDGLALVVGPTTVATDGATFRTAVLATDGLLYVAYGSASTARVRYAVHDAATLAQSVAPVDVHLLTTSHLALAPIDATSALLVYTDAPSGPPEATRTVRVTSAGTVDTSTRRTTFNAAPIATPFHVGGRVYLPMGTVRQAVPVGKAYVTQNVSFVVEVELTDNLGEDTSLAGVPHRLAAVVHPRVAAREPAKTLPASPSVGDRVVFPALYLTQLTVNGGESRAASLVTVTPASRGARQVGRALVLDGGALAVYDGWRADAALFLQAPRVVSATPGSGGSMVAGVYQYVFVYEWRDATGLLHRSIPSFPVTVSVGASGKVDFVLECAGASGRQRPPHFESDVKIVPYRTTVGGTTFFRMAFDGSLTASNVVVSTRTATTTYTDTRADGNIGHATPLNSRPVLYTTGGVIDDAMPPSLDSMTLHRGRFWGVAGDRRTIWFSKSFTEDPGVFPGFHEDLRVVLDEDVTALASLDASLAVFTRDSVYVVTGDGPSVTLDGSTLSAPERVQSDAGCIEPRSVVETPDGVMFLSRRGLYLLTRGLELRWVGQQVRDTLERYPRVRSALLVPERGHVRFVCEGDEGGRVLVYDYVNRVWSVFVMPGPLTAQVVHGGAWRWAIGSAVRTEDDATRLDAGAWVTLSFEIGWVSEAGPVGWQRVRRVQMLGERVTDHNLRIEIGFDHREAYAQGYTFVAEQVRVNGDCPTVRVGAQNGANPRCKAIRVRVTDAPPSDVATYPVGAGVGGIFSAIALEIEPKLGPARHGAAASKV